MKKLIFSLAAIAIGTLAYAQKPAAGDKTIETTLDLNFGNPGITYGSPELRFRYFSSESMAFRLRLNLGSSSSTVKENNDSTEIKTSSGFELGLSPGVEFHLPGTTKLSPYFGAQLPISFGTGATIETTEKDPTLGNTTTTGGSVFGIGLNLVIGADYYITDGIYVGAETGLGLFNMTSIGEGSTKITIGGTTIEQKTGTSSTFDLFGVNPTAGIRLGMRF
jgi:outer membrane protein W